MKRWMAAVSLTAMLIAAAPGIYAQTPPASSAKPAANAVDPASIQALKDMGAYLQTLKRFRVSTELTGERVLRDGQKLQHSARADLDVARPSKLRARMSSAKIERELIYDGKTVTLYTPAQKYYSTIEFSEPIGQLIERLEERYGVEFPLADLFRWGTPAAPLDKIESAMYAGQDLVGKDLCDHYAFRQGTLDYQVWITTGAAPLPRKVVIINRGDEARPQSVSVITWALKAAVQDSVFSFKPPQGAKKVEIAQRKAK